MKNEVIKEIIAKVVLEEAVIKLNSAPKAGEPFDIEKHNHTNRMLNEMNGFIYDELVKRLSL